MVLISMIDRKDRTTLISAGATGIGFGIGIIIYLIYNHALVGEWFTPPLYLTSPANRLGFGKNIGSDWGIFSTPAHTPWRAVLNLNSNLTVMNNDLFGWPVSSLLFVLLVLCFGKWDRRHRLCLTMISSLVIAQSFYWFHGVAFGARFYYALLPYLIMLTLEGLWQFPSLWREKFASKMSVSSIKLYLKTLVVLFFAFSFIAYIPRVSLISPYPNQRGINMDLYQFARQDRQEKELIFVKTDEPFFYAPGFIANDLNIESSDVIFALDRGQEENVGLIGLFPDRRVRYYTYEYKDTWVKGMARKILLWLKGMKNTPDT